MKKILFLFVFLAFLFTSVYALDITIPKDTITIYSGSSVDMNITIKNSATTTQMFSVSVFPPQYEGVMSSVYPQIVLVQPGEEKEVTISFSALKSAKPTSTIFTINVKNMNNPSLNYTKAIIVMVFRKSQLYLYSLNLNKYVFDPNENVEASARVSNVIKQLSPPAVVDFKLYYDNKVIDEIKKEIETVAPESYIDVNASFKLDKYAPNGTYKIVAVLKDVKGNVIDTLENKFRVRAVYKLPEEYTKKETHWRILSTKTTITIKNDGNVPTPEFYVSESMPMFMKDFFKPSVEPTEVTYSGGRVIYKWLIPSLKPGRSIVITYEVSLWGVWISLIIIGVIVYFLFRQSFAPTIRKKAGSIDTISPEKEIPIIIEIKNNSRFDMKNVIVQDILPPMVKIVSKFDTPKPEIKKTKKAVELRWRFNKIKTGDERVLVYYVKPLVDITGGVELPPAKMIYYNQKNEKKVLSSGIVWIRKKSKD